MVTQKEIPLITLSGYIKRVIKREDNTIIVTFVDDNYGELKCNVTRSCNLFYDLKLSTKYELGVVIKGRPNRDRGIYYLNNTIYVKKSKKISPPVK